MDAIDWKAPARLHGSEGAASGSDSHGPREGTVAELVHHVSLLSAEHRAGLAIELKGGRSLDLGEILELAAREDLGE
jgi:hypothetical protein